MSKILEELIKESSKQFFKELAKTTITKAAHQIVTEVIRAKVDVWRRVKIKKEYHELDQKFREEAKEKSAKKDKAKKESKPSASEEQPEQETDSTADQE